MEHISMKLDTKIVNSHIDIHYELWYDNEVNSKDMAAKALKHGSRPIW